MYRMWSDIATKRSPVRPAAAPAVARKKSCQPSGRYGSISRTNVRRRSLRAWPARRWPGDSEDWGRSAGLLGEPEDLSRPGRAGRLRRSRGDDEAAYGVQEVAWDSLLEGVDHR